MSNIPTTVFNNGRFLAHIAWLPKMATQRNVAALSRMLNKKSYTKSYYELKAGEESPNRLGLTRTFREQGKLLTGRYSLPHATIMHFWANPEEATSVFCQLRDKLRIAPTNKDIRIQTRGLELFGKVPRWLGKPGQFDYAACINIGRDGLLLKANRVAAQIAEDLSLTRITATGDQWFPHFTLANEPIEQSKIKGLILTKDTACPLSTEYGEIGIGISGPNGQFRGLLASMGENPQPSRTELLTHFEKAVNRL